MVPDPLATLIQPMAAIVHLDKKQRIPEENLDKSGSTTFFKSEFCPIVSILLNFEKNICCVQSSLMLHFPVGEYNNMSKKKNNTFLCNEILKFELIQVVPITDGQLFYVLDFPYCLYLKSVVFFWHFSEFFQKICFFSNK